MRLSLILPCYNEVGNITAVVADCVAWFASRLIDGDVIVVNDGSRDGTAGVLRSLSNRYPQLSIITHRENRGYGAAVRSGCDAATGAYIAFMDSDGQFRAEDFDQLLVHLDRYVFVTGRRRRRADPFMRKVNAKLFGFLTWAVLGIWVRDINCAMKVWRRDLWPQIRPRLATGALFNAELFLRLKRSGIVWKQVDVDHYPRRFGLQTGAKSGVILRMFREMWQLRCSAED
jgi:glycosyltransferase involved in cell wall biosynthesis